jgi:hypothetical protein
MENKKIDYLQIEKHDGCFPSCFHVSLTESESDELLKFNKAKVTLLRVDSIKDLLTSKPVTGGGLWVGRKLGDGNIGNTQ